MASVDDGPNFNGYWKLKRNDENFDKYLQAVGLNFFLRKMIQAATVYQDIEQSGNAFKIQVILPVAKQEMTFNVGEPFEYYHNVRKVTLHRIAKWDGKALVTTPLKEDDDDSLVERRELEEGMLVLTLIKGDVSTKRYFEKIEKK